MKKEDEDLDTDQETDRLLGQQYNDGTGYYDTAKLQVGQRQVKSHDRSNANGHIKTGANVYNGGPPGRAVPLPAPPASHHLATNCPACLAAQENESSKKKPSKTKEVLIEGVLFRARY